MLEHVGVRLDPLLPKRSLPAETTVRRLLARIDGDTLDLAVGRWLADRRNRTQSRPRGLAIDGKSLRGAVRANGRKIHLAEVAPPRVPEIEQFAVVTRNYVPSALGT
ncbi:hypothetical protein [Streptomyces bottropensis]|uniref:hypothetical protein n=1 Tax=Streptomyces bottropensis TaxID=42235 RepID=UPI0036745423